MIDDKELIRKFTAGDEKAFDQIVQNNLNNVFGFFMKITRDEMAAEDLTQDVFLKLYKNLKNILDATEEKLVSIDFNHNSNSAIVDLSLTNVVGNKMGKVSAWYDNEWGFASRMCDLAEYIHKI